MIWVDADACPVKAEVEKVATRHRIPVRMVCDGGLRPSANPLIEVVYVTEGPDAADDRIAEEAGPGDIVVTGDIPLADRALAARARVITHTGEELTTRNIAERLAARNAADARRAETVVRMTAVAPQTPQKAPDKGRFANALERIVREVQKHGR